MEPFSKAWWGGIATATIVLTAIIAPRTCTVLMLVVLSIAIADHVFRKGLPRQPERFMAPFAAIVAFAIWAMMSALWSPAFFHSLFKPVFLILVVVAVWLAMRSASTGTKPVVHYVGEGAMIGAAIAYILVGVEILTGQLITRSLMTAIPALHANIPKHVTVSGDGTVLNITIANLNRRMSILIWLFWPVMMLAYYDTNRLRRMFAYGAAAFGISVILLYGSHQSSQVAILGGIVTFAAAIYMGRKFLLTALTGAWIAIVLLAVPIALSVFYADAHKAEWLFRSARHRVVIWGTTAEEVLRTPILGVGADATRKAMRIAVKRSAADPSLKRDLGQFKSGYANHAHNVYLQVWYELGAIGALLFLGIGVTALNAIGRLKPVLQPVTIAMFVTTSLMIAFSYSMWQTWFISAFGMSAALLAIAIRKRSDNEGPGGSNG